MAFSLEAISTFFPLAIAFFSMLFTKYGIVRSMQSCPGSGRGKVEGEGEGKGEGDAKGKGRRVGAKEEGGRGGEGEGPVCHLERLGVG